jgi:hypothetical protein
LLGFIIFTFSGYAWAFPVDRYRCVDKLNPRTTYEITFSEEEVRHISVTRFSQDEGIDDIFNNDRIYDDEIDLSGECFYAVSDFPHPWLNFQCDLKNRRGRVSGTLEFGYGSQNRFSIEDGPQILFSDCEQLARPRR